MSRVMSLLSTATEIGLLDAAELASDDLIACSAWMVRVSLLKYFPLLLILVISRLVLIFRSFIPFFYVIGKP